MKKTIAFFTFLLFSFFLFCQEIKQTDVLKNIAIKEKEERESLLKIANQKGWALVIEHDKNKSYLTSVDVKGFPVYTQVDNNATSAITTKTNSLWTNQFNVNGSSSNMKGKLALWDEGCALKNHVEFDGRILVKDNAASINHSTHVAGTLMAVGKNTLAKGMAWGAEQLVCYDFDKHISEIAVESSNLLISNHSYGNRCGWNKNGRTWEYYGLQGDTADYKFGIYNYETQMLDSIAFYAPNYLMVKSAGNYRNSNGPAVGDSCFMYNSNQQNILTPRPQGISSNNSYDIIPTYGVAKNILTVGSIVGTLNNTEEANNINISDVSSWGPTDDGRIKPDLVAAGVDVYSCSSDSATAYWYNSGTSMAAPNVSGSLFLLQELFSQKNNGNFMKAATLKALAIATATEAGRAKGPDYEYGWGLLNGEKAGNTILDATIGKAKLLDTLLQNNQTITLPLKADGSGKIITTVAWTDVPGQATITNLLNNPSLKLINDIDIKIIKNNKTYLPWILNPAQPSNAATTGDNFRDNVERIDIDSTNFSDTFYLKISHKGSLVNGSQRVGLVVIGIDDSSYCTPYTLASNNIRIDSFKFNNLKIKSTGCNTYDNYKNIVENVEPYKPYDVQIAVSSCNGNKVNKAFKLYIDYNGNKVFDNNEMVLRSNVFSNDTLINSTIPISNFVAVNKTVLMRLIVVETNDINSFTACNATTINGTTQDFSLYFQKPKVDIAATSIETPNGNICSNSKQFISTKLTNKGSVAVNNFRVTASVLKGASTIYMSTENVSTNIEPNETIVFTFQKPIELLANNNYSINVVTALTNDQVANNNSTSTTFTILPKANQVSGQARLCKNIVQFSAINSSQNQSYAWYASPDSLKQVAAGTKASSNIISNKYFLSAGASVSLGAINKTISDSGDYQDKAGNYFYYSSLYPLLLQSAKLYTANAGKLTIIAADTVKTYNDGKYDYKVLSSTTIDVAASKPQSQSGYVQGNDTTDKGLYYNINLLLPGGNHILIVKSDSVANVFRNKKTKPSIYPFKANNLISLYKTNAATDSFYYYLYDMKLASLDCESEKLVLTPTAALKPIITKIGDSLQSSLGSGYQWQLNNQPIANATNEFYKPTQNGSYTVIVKNSEGCEQVSDAFTIGQTVDSINFKVYPNPAKSVVNFSLNSIGNGFAKVIIHDIVGRVVAVQSINITSNNFIGQINVSGLKNDFYTLQVVTEHKTYTSKLVIAR